MFVELHSSIVDVDAALMSRGNLLERLLTAHYHGHIILTLSPAEVAKVKGVPGLGCVSLAMLDLIGRRANEYAAASARSERFLQVCTNECEPNISIIHRSARVSERLLTADNLRQQTFLLAENVRDAQFYISVASLYLENEGYPTSFVKFRLVGGGGSTTADALDAEEGAPLRGAIICDRDVASEIPPFPLNSTGRRAHEASQARNLIDNQLGFSETNPFFGFMGTWGRILENYVGPHVLDLYFDANGRRDERQPFLRAFPTFPSLTPQEAQVWRLLNLKDKTPSLRDVLTWVRTMFGQPNATVTRGSRHYQALSIPRDVVDWMITSESGGRQYRELRAALRRDLTIPAYRDGLTSLASFIRTLGAGDAQAIRA